MKLLDHVWHWAATMFRRSHAHGVALRAVLRAALATTLLAQCALIQPASAAGTNIEWRALSTTPSDQSCKVVLFEQPRAIAIDRDNNIYVANERGANALQRIALSGTITTLVDRTAVNLKGQSYLNLSLAIDRTGQIVLGVGGRGTIERLTKEGVLTILAGQPGKKGIVDGPADKAEFKAITAVAVGPDGDIYVADSRTIRKLSKDGLVSTVAGDEHSKADCRDGRGRAAAFGGPKGLVVDDSGYLYVADGGERNDEGRITSFGLVRKVDRAGIVESIAGQLDSDGGHLDGVGRHAEFTELFGIAIDAHSNLFVTEDYFVSRFHVRKISPTLDVTTILSAEELADFQKDRDGPDVALHEPTGIAVDPSGIPYFVDTGGNKLHRIDKQSKISEASPGGYSEAYVTTLCRLTRPTGSN